MRGPRRTTATPLSFALMIAVCVAFATPAHAGADGVTCRQAIGRVERLEGGQWRLLRGGEALSPGQKLRSAPLAFATFRLPGVGGLTLSGAAEVTLGPAGGEPVSLLAGEAHIGLEETASDIVFGSVRLSPTEPGTLVRLTRRASGTELVLVRGAARAKVASEEVVLTSGEGLPTETDAPASRFSVLPAPAAVGPGPDERFFCPGLIVRLEWEAQPLAHGYRVEVAEDAAFSLGVLTRETEVARSQFVPRSPGRYFWRVSARDEHGRWGTTSAGAPLFCEKEPPRDHLRLPAAGASAQPPRPGAPLELTWDPAAGAQAYRVVVAPGDQLNSPAAFRRSTTEPRLALTDTLPEGDYVWGVYVEDSYAGQPLFLSPRPLKIRKVTRSSVRIPSALNEWGQ